ncbi:hypothetical protein [Halolamina litorea]|uniref:Small CPxCG-related zinc finger protein n=1 Tax=Halolamina litorea TaxID=1515593 RepID=A0ABD6BUN4_9EURY|nr:hypothetical protein [Halolamina litorea]
MSTTDVPTCNRCGARDATVDRQLTHATDPLQVTECRRCGAILSIGGHEW